MPRIITEKKLVPEEAKNGSMRRQLSHANRNIRTPPPPTNLPSHFPPLPCHSFNPSPSLTPAHFLSLSTHPPLPPLPSFIRPSLLSPLFPFFPPILPSVLQPITYLLLLPLFLFFFFLPPCFSLKNPLSSPLYISSSSHLYPPSSFSFHLFLPAFSSP